MLSSLVGPTWHSMIVMLLLLFLSPVLGKGPVQRLNYGVLFKPTPPAYFATENWVHTYEVKLPNAPAIPHLSICNSGNATCAVLRQIQTHLNQIKSKCILYVNQTNSQISNIIPESKLSLKSRSKRGYAGIEKTLLDFNTKNSIVKQGTSKRLTVEMDRANPRSLVV